MQTKDSPRHLHRWMGNPLLATKRKISATLIKWSESASSYPGKLLGMLGIHLLINAIKELYGMMSASNILCDNKRTLYTFKRKSKRIPAGAKNNNVQRVLWQVKIRVKSLHLLHHVKARQDGYKNVPTSPQRLNNIITIKSSLGNAIFFRFFATDSNLLAWA